MFALVMVIGLLAQVGAAPFVGLDWVYESPCGVRRDLTGGVRTVVHHGPSHVLSETTLSRDGRLQETTLSDWGGSTRLVSVFDDQGRLLEQRSVPQRDPGISTSCSYDDAGRTRTRTVRQGGKLYTVESYSYDSRLISVRFKSDVTEFVTNYELDTRGRTVRQARKDAAGEYQVYEHRYPEEHVRESCFLDQGRSCHVRAVDAHGRPASDAYVYDAAGNWTERSPRFTVRPGQVERREITYWR